MSNAIKALRDAEAKIQKAEAAGRSVSTLNRLWRAYFAAEDALKLAQTGGWS